MNPLHRMDDWDLKRDGFCLLPSAVSAEVIEPLLDLCRRTFADDTADVGARSSAGHVYAARNLLQSLPAVRTLWRTEALLSFLREQLGERFGLVRALFFDKPPDRTWNLTWHKDTSVAVRDNTVASAFFSRPTTKAGVPHLIAADGILQQMLTLRIHLDDVTDENGPLRVIPGSHVSKSSSGVGVERAVTILATAGDVLAMRPLITHASGSSLAGTRRHRRILHLEFAAEESLPDGLVWHDFIHESAQFSGG